MHVGATWTVLEQFSTSLIGEVHATCRNPCWEQCYLLWTPRGYCKQTKPNQKPACLKMSKVQAAWVINTITTESDICHFTSQENEVWDKIPLQEFSWALSHRGDLSHQAIPGSQHRHSHLAIGRINKPGFLFCISQQWYLSDTLLSKNKNLNWDDIKTGNKKTPKGKLRCHSHIGFNKILTIWTMYIPNE